MKACRLTLPPFLTSQNTFSLTTCFAFRSIVVTTYAVLSSDNTYWRKKSKDPDSYVSPCQKLRWWRIILDESHAIKQKTSAHTNAVKMLVGENRWCVTGTPFNNSMEDIISQVNFLGLKPFNERTMKLLFSVPFVKLTNHSQWRRRQTIKEQANMPTPGVAFFLTLMRKFLMRHTKEQKRIGSGAGLVSLPPKTKKTIYIDFTADETSGYTKFEEVRSEYRGSEATENPHVNIYIYIISGVKVEASIERAKRTRTPT